MCDPSFQLQLGACDIAGMFFDIDSDQDISLDEARSLLSTQEQLRADRFKFEIHRDRFTRGRGFLRRGLGLHLAVDPTGLKLLTGPKGKPELAENPVWFNLSHCEGGAVLVLSSDGAIGVDLERHDRNVDVMSLAEAVFTQSESDLIASQPDEATRRRLFFEFWTAKEARMKMTGEGMSLAPKNISLGFDEAGLPSFCSEPAMPETALAYVSCVEEASCAVAAPRHL